MAVPKKRTSVCAKRLRRAGYTHKLTAKNPMTCPNCGELTLPNRVCSACGQLRGKQAFTVKAATTEETENTEA